MEPVAVLGGGSWGTALAWLLGGKGIEVRLWVRDPAAAAAMASERRNPRYHPDLLLPPPVTPTADLTAACSGIAAAVAAVPVGALRQTFEAVRGLLPDAAAVVLASKGLEMGTGRRMSEVAAEVLGARVLARVAALSGPNLAAEIVRGDPAVTVVAGANPALLAGLQQLFGTPSFRVYTNTDLPGVELGGALKNPLAIAAGISDGLGFGSNARAGLLTRGLAEITRLGSAAGGRRETFAGLSGLGDLMATAHSPFSRNYRYGFALGRGATPAQAAEEVRQVVEGVPTTKASCLLAARVGIEAPVLIQLHSTLFEGVPPAEAVRRLMTRPYREEQSD